MQKKKRQLSETFTENLNRMLGDERGVNAALAHHCGVGRGVVSKWRYGGSQPRLDDIAEIAMFLKKKPWDLLKAKPGRRANGN